MTSGIFRVDDSLQMRDYFEPLRQRLDDDHSVRASAPTENLGEFAIATMAIAPGIDPFHPETPGDMPNRHIGRHRARLASASTIAEADGRFGLARRTVVNAASSPAVRRF